jgi:Flp pilus assembly pilin Flp
MLAFKSFIAGLYARTYARTEREEGQALVEYALILGLVSVVAIALLSAVGGNITQLLARVTGALASAL